MHSENRAAAALRVVMVNAHGVVDDACAAWHGDCGEAGEAREDDDGRTADLASSSCARRHPPPLAVGRPASAGAAASAADASCSVTFSSDMIARLRLARARAVPRRTS